jgi:hypothetical protein
MVVVVVVVTAATVVVGATVVGVELGTTTHLRFLATLAQTRLLPETFTI